MALPGTPALAATAMCPAPSCRATVTLSSRTFLGLPGLATCAALCPLMDF